MSLRPDQSQKYDFCDMVDACQSVSTVRTDNFKTPTTSRPNAQSSTASKTKLVNRNRTPSSALRRPSTTTCTSSSRSVSHSVIVALAEGRGHARGEIGMASLDLKNPELILSQFPDRHTYIKTLTKIYILQPLEVVFPNTAFESGSMSGVIKLINDNFPKTATIAVQRRYFNEAKGLEYIQRLRIPECTAIEMLIADKYYALAAAAALLKYVEFIQNVVYSAKSLKVQYAGGENTTMIDMKTCINLELLLNTSDPKNEHTLFGVLHNTKTIGGTRLLRANILQPPFCTSTTNTRLDCVHELLHNDDLLDNLQVVIAKFVDVDHLLSLCVQVPNVDNLKTAESKIANVIHLKHTLELIEPLASALESTECALLRSYQDMLSDGRYKVIYEKIVQVIQPDSIQQKGALNMRTQKCFAVKSNINGLLDVARRSYAEIIDDIMNLVKQMAETYGLPLKIGHTCSNGFFIQLPVGRNRSISTEQLPPIFIKVIKSKNMIRCTTEDLMKLNVRVEESLNEIYLMSNVIVRKLLEDITEQIGCLYKLSEIISTLDMLLAFALAANTSDYVRPEFTDTLAISDGRHPILDRISSNPIVANNTFLSNDLNFGIITGPNMSGKSTYLKQVALLQIMAQIGCYVPAKYASFRLADHIYSRAGSTDDIETNTSTFVMEMKEVSYIINTATNSSFIVIDELGRGTSVEEGIGICHTVCEHLIRTKVFTLFATHFLELAKLEGTYPNVMNFNFEVETGDDEQMKCQFSYKIKQGKSTDKRYGIRLAEMSLIDETIIANAKMVANSVQDNVQSQKDVEEENEIKAVVNLSNKLHQVASNSTLSPTRLATVLETFQDEFQLEIKHINRPNSE